MSKMPAPSKGIGPMTKSYPVTIEIPVRDLDSQTDIRLATYWHVAQANPAPDDDLAAGELVRRIGEEIIRRWLAKAPAERHNHEERTHYYSMLCAVGTWTGPNHEFELKPETPEFKAALAKLKAADENGQGE